MKPPYLELSGTELLIAVALILVNGAVSVWLRLGLERSLTIAALRTIIQLSLIGIVLEIVFDVDRPALILGLMLIMTLIAGSAACDRAGYRYPGVRLNSIIAVWTSSWLILAVTLGGIIPIRPWYNPQYAIPLLGMLLGNALNGISLGLDRIQAGIDRDRNQIEMLLCLGASRWEAARDTVRDAIRTGLTPIINSMAVVGLVSLPGMMTGQLLSGVAPEHAIRYQIVIMFLIASTTALGTVLIVLMTFQRLFTSSHRLDVRQLRKAGRNRR